MVYGLIGIEYKSKLAFCLNKIALLNSFLDVNLKCYRESEQTLMGKKNLSKTSGWKIYFFIFFFIFFYGSPKTSLKRNVNVTNVYQNGVEWLFHRDCNSSTTKTVHFNSNSFRHKCLFFRLFIQIMYIIKSWRCFLLHFSYVFTCRVFFFLLLQNKQWLWRSHLLF